MILRFLIALIIASNCIGCASFNVYDRVSDSRFRSAETGSPGQVQIVRGRPNRFIDGAGEILGIPNKLALAEPRVDNHQVSSETESEIAQYISDNGLESVLVRINQYDPRGEWRRLVQNKQIRPFWRATFGNYNLLKYTLLPGRLLGGDWYNPYTNTLNVYSDVPSLAIAQAGYAADLQTRLNPGAYSAVRELPLLGLQPEAMVTQATLDYYEHRVPEKLEEAHRILFPSYGASVGGQVASFFPYGNVLGRLVGGGLGQAANKIRR